MFYTIQKDSVCLFLLPFCCSIFFGVAVDNMGAVEIPWDTMRYLTFTMVRWIRNHRRAKLFNTFVIRGLKFADVCLRGHDGSSSMLWPRHTFGPFWALLIGKKMMCWGWDGQWHWPTKSTRHVVWRCRHTKVQHQLMLFECLWILFD